MKKHSYKSSDNNVEVQGPRNDLSEKDTATENGGRGFNLIEMTSEFDKLDKDNKSHEESSNISNQVFDLLISLGDELDSDNKESLSNFTDFLLRKFAEAENNVDYSILFNNLMIKVNNSDLINTNEMIKKLAKIYSRTFVLEFGMNQDKEKSKKSAYKKTLHRANQYLSEV
jgi:hypothetical protein